MTPRRSSYLVTWLAVMAAVAAMAVFAGTSTAVEDPKSSGEKAANGPAAAKKIEEKPKPAAKVVAPRVKAAAEKEQHLRAAGLYRPEDRSGPALRGYCPVAYIVNREARRGDSKVASTYGGQVFHLSSAEAKKIFDKYPEKYLPQFDGLCTMALGGPYGNRFDGDPEVYDLRQGKVYLFSSQRALNGFTDGPPSVLDEAEKRFERPLLHGYCPVSLHTEKKVVKGDPKYRAPWRGYMYHLASAEAREQFLKDPSKYAPAYRGFCATAVADYMKRVGKEEIVRVYAGRTYLFADEAARKRFDENPAELVKKADVNWTALRGKK